MNIGGKLLKFPTCLTPFGPMKPYYNPLKTTENLYFDLLENIRKPVFSWFQEN